MQASETCWRPLVHGEAAAQARAAALHIALALEAQGPSPLAGLKGDAAIALLLAECGRDSASTRLEDALRSAVAQPSMISLFGGLSGVAWVLAQLAQGDEAAELVAHFDAALLRHLDVPRWNDRLDLVSGVAGVGVYASGRRDRQAWQLADRVLSHLEASAILTDAGATWYASPQASHARRRGRPAGEWVELGVAHGVPGIIGVLAQLVEADLFAERALRLLEPAVAWLLDSVPAGRPRFGEAWPPWDTEIKQIGWCHGDLGVAGVLLYVSSILRSSQLEEVALELLRGVAVLLTEQDVSNVGFCHGVAGLVHSYNVAFQRTGSPEMHAQALRWLAELVRRRAPGQAGLTIDGAAPRAELNTTLLAGEVGVALVLLAATDSATPAWQRLFLL